MLLLISLLAYEKATSSRTTLSFSYGNSTLSFSSANFVFEVIPVIWYVNNMAAQASFTIRQVAPTESDVATAEPPAETTEKPAKRRTIRDKRLKDKGEKKKSKKPPGNVAIYIIFCS